MEILLLFLEFALPILSVILTIVAAALAKKWLKKLGVESSEKVDAMIDNYVEKGVLAAERAASAYITVSQGKMPGGDKKAHAIKVVLGELEQSGLKDVAKELIAARIEAYLEGKEPGKLPTGEVVSTEA